MAGQRRAPRGSATPVANPLDRVAYAVDGEINRKDFGMNFEMMADGKLIVGNEIKLHVEGELVETADVQEPVKAEQPA